MLAMPYKAGLNYSINVAKNQQIWMFYVAIAPHQSGLLQKKFTLVIKDCRLMADKPNNVDTL